MRLSLSLSLSILPLLLPGLASAAKVPKNAILLSDVKSLTLRGGGAKTTNRRVAAAPQLRCISSKAICDLYDIDVMRCTNQGAGYSPEDIQWSCIASLPEELKLGSTDVICEGYSSPDDPYVLRGSCGVEYRLALTDKGERRYPNLGKGRGGGEGRGDVETDWGAYLFGILFFAVLAWIVYSACVAGAQNRRTGGTGRRRGGGGGGGGPGGGGGGGWDPGFGQNDDPPPPYPGTKPSNQGGQQQGWRPGFWTGAGAGAAAGYGAGRYANSNRGYGTDNWGRDSGSSWGAGPSRSSTSSSSSSARHESTGFGSTNRR